MTDWTLAAGDPDWSPDGSTIVYSTMPLLSFDNGPSQLFLMDPDGTDVRQLTPNTDDGSRATQPRWSPDGRAVLYTKELPNGRREIWSIAADGTGWAIALGRQLLDVDR